jgi:hypothetical protein
VVHDLGPRRIFEPSLLEMIGTSGRTGTGRWTMSALFNGRSAHKGVTRVVVGPITCAWCHREAVVNHAGRARYCSDACRQASHRDSHRDEYSAATRAWRARLRAA